MINILNMQFFLVLRMFRYFVGVGEGKYGFKIINKWCFKMPGQCSQNVWPGLCRTLWHLSNHTI